jgi:LmbE family N-acetylglucosaminyl deacetylase
MENILVIVAHPDDEIIGVGGTLRKHVKQGDHVSVLILGDGKTSRQSEYKPLKNDAKAALLLETKNALRILGIDNLSREYLPDNRFDSLALLDIVKIVSNYIEKISPTLIYTHHSGDLNIDHQLTAEATIIATRPIQNAFLRELRMFETLSSTEQSGSRLTHAFIPNLFINIDNEINDKINALSCYKSELHDFPHPRSLEAIKYNAHVWGAKNNQVAVEPFYIFRKYIK